MGFVEQIHEAIISMSLIEGVAVITGILYLVLAAKESIWCWFFAAISTVLYIYILWDVKLYAETALQFYYLFMAGYGFYQWKYNHTKQESEMPISVLSMKKHLILISIIVVLSIILGVVLSTLTDAQLPFIDSFTTVGALVVTWMVTKKYLENWLYWIVVDGVAVYQYFSKELYLTSLLFVIYVIMVVFGFFKWKADYNNQVYSN